jgi:RNA polymerase sigma-70 factor, ECF subfamily
LDRQEDWQCWFDAQAATLMLLARQWVPTVGDAEDVVEQGFLSFWRKRSGVRDPLAYLYVCVKSAALGWRRRQRRRARSDGIVAIAQEQAIETTVDADQETRERRVFVETALVSLPEQQREVVVMKIWGGLTFAQIAEVQNVPPATAASRYRYALAALRMQLDKDALNEWC